MAEQTGSLRIALAAGEGAAGILSQVNPEGVDLIITRLVIDLQTKATGACTADFGVAATAVSNDTLLDGVDLGTAAGVFDNVENQGTNGAGAKKWPAGQYLTGSKATGNAAGLAGYAHVQYVRA